jgi:hypothetical protein
VLLPVCCWHEAQVPQCTGRSADGGRAAVPSALRSLRSASRWMKGSYEVSDDGDTRAFGNRDGDRGAGRGLRDLRSRRYFGARGTALAGQFLSLGIEKGAAVKHQEARLSAKIVRRRDLQSAMSAYFGGLPLGLLADRPDYRQNRVLYLGPCSVHGGNPEVGVKIAKL